MSDQVKSFLFAKKIATSSRDDWNLKHDVGTGFSHYCAQSDMNVQ
jgi:hypothetical protein